MSIREWVIPVMQFATRVLPDLLTALGKSRAGEAFDRLADLYRDHGGDAEAARAGIRDIVSRSSEVAARRSKRDAELADQEARSRKSNEPTTRPLRRKRRAPESDSE